MIRSVALAIPCLLLAGCFSQPPAPAVDRSAPVQARAAAPQPSGPGYYTVKRGDTLYRIAMENGQDYKDIAAWNNLANPSAIKEGQVLRVAPPGTGESAGTVVTKPVATGPVVESRSLDQSAASTVSPPPAAQSSNPALKREPRAGKEPYSDEAYNRLNKLGDASPPPPASAEAKPEQEQAVPAAPAAPATPPVAAGPDEVSWLWPSPGKVLATYSDAGNKGLDIAGKAGDPVLASADGKVVYAGAGLRGYGELIIVKHNATYLSAYAHNRKILVKEGQQVTRGQKIAEMGSTDTDSVKLHFEIRKQGKPVDPSQYLPKR